MVRALIFERRARSDLRWCDPRHGSIADQRRNAEARKKPTANSTASKQREALQPSQPKFSQRYFGGLMPA
jgi:hypothetical protein